MTAKAAARRTRQRRWLSALFALAVLLLLLGGIPTLLAATIGDPTAGVPDLLAADVTDVALIDLLAAVAWLAWAQFALATLVELVSGLRRSPMPRRIPGVFSGQQQLARVLVTALLLSPTVAAALLHPSPPAHAEDPSPHPTAISGGLSVGGAPQTAGRTGRQRRPAPGTHAKVGRAPAGQPEGRATEPPLELSGKASATVYVVPAEDGPATYWDLAETRLGSGQRWQEIWQLNEGRRQADGAVMTSPRLLRPGWTVLVPDPHHAGHRAGTVAGSSAATRAAIDLGRVEVEVEVTVRAGDTVSQIAADHGEADWHDTWHANAGRVEPDGARFTNPDLIRPGWQLTVAEPASPSTPTLPTPQTRQSPPPTRLPVEPRTPIADTVQPPMRAMPADPGRSPAGDTPPASPRAAGGTEPAAGGGSAPAHHTGSPAITEAAGVVAFGGAGAVLAALTLICLRRHRRRQFRHRAAGRMIAATPPELAPMEKALLTQGQAGTADVTWLNAALRSLAHTVATDPDGRLPDVVAVRITQDVLDLVLAAPHGDPPGPWRAAQGGLRWSVDRADPLPFDAADVEYHFAPYPALVTIGSSSSGEHWLLDLERIGVLSLTGDPQRCADLGRFLAAELAHNCWSEQLNVTLVGFGEQLRGLNPCRVRAVNGPRELTQTLLGLNAALRDNAAITGQAGTDTLTGRLRMLHGDGWPPDVLLIAPNTPEAALDPDGLQILLKGLRSAADRTAVAVVLVGADDPADDPADDLADDDKFGEQQAAGDGWRLHLDPVGTLTIPALGIALQAQRLPAAEAADLAALLALAAEGPDQPMPAARGAQPWDVYADAAGAPRPDLTHPPAACLQPLPDGVIDLTETPPRVAEIAPPDSDSVLPLPAAVYLQRAATTVSDLDALAPRMSSGVPGAVGGADPELDGDLADWHDPDSTRPKLRLLGPVTLTAWGKAPGRRPAFYLEVVVYLASRPHGATLEQFAADLWPDTPDVATKSTLRQTASAARLWLGVNPRTAAPYLSKALDTATGTRLYQVQDLLVDAELFRRLRLRAIAGPTPNIADLEAALNLVTGIPLEQRRPDGYSWLVDLPLEHEYTAMIVDVAHLVATHHLATDAPGRAEAAANTALLAGARDDVALLDLVAACDAAGNQAEADSYVRRILANHEAEVEEDLPPRTCEILLRRHWLPRPSSGPARQPTPRHADEQQSAR